MYVSIVPKLKTKLRKQATDFSVVEVESNMGCEVPLKHKYMFGLI